MRHSEETKALVELLNAPSKKDVERRCRTLIVTKTALANLVMAGRIGVLGNLIYACRFHHYTPEHLEPSSDELRALGGSSPGPLEGKALKFVRKIQAGISERRLLNVHLFYTPEHKGWHMFYFDQRDAAQFAHHWKHGCHIHYSSDLIVSGSLEAIWNDVLRDKPKMPKSIHVRYQRDG